MSVTTPTSKDHRVHTGPLEVAFELFWLFVIAGLVLSLSLIVLGGPRVIAATAVQLALVTMLVLLAWHVWSQHRHHAEIEHDERLQRARERRGF